MMLGALLIKYLDRGRLKALANAQDTADISRLRREMTVFEMATYYANDGVIIQDLDARIVWCNPAYTRITGYTIDEIRNRKPQEFVIPEEQRPSQAEIDAFRYDIDSGVLNDFEVIQNIRKDGTLFWNQLSFAVVEFDDASETRVFVICRDITDQIEKEQALEHAKEAFRHQADHDALTGLPNRKKLSDTTLELVRDTEKYQKYGVLQIDLDRFKHINDTLGHAAGDAILVQAAERLQRVVGEQDIVCRAGGDEFTIICPHVKCRSEVELIGRRILEAFDEAIDWNGKRLSVGVSIGIALSDQICANADTILTNADIALYDVKRNGRGNIRFFDQQLGQKFFENQKILEELRVAIRDSQLGVYFQPQLDIDRRKLVGFEALIRWWHPTRGVLSPGAFLPVAEENGLSAALDRVAIVCGLDGLRTFHDLGFKDLRMSLNMASQTLETDALPEFIDNEIQTRNIRPDKVTIEVLETTLFDHQDTVVRAIDRLSNTGYGVELDDFGTGHAGLAHLSNLQISGLKIDRSMIDTLVDDVTKRTIVEAVLLLCQKLGLRVVCEGVETAEQAHSLACLGGSILQGYGLARPMPLEDAKNWLRENRFQEFVSAIDAVDRVDVATANRKPEQVVTTPV